MHISIKRLVVGLFFISFFCWSFAPKHRPRLFLIGDSTVADGSGHDGLFGWGKFLPNFFDTNKIEIRNYAVGGTSSRTFMTKGVWNPKLASNGLWDSVAYQLQKGDYLIIQFGHNDASPVNDTARSRGTLAGIGDSSTTITNAMNHKIETVHTYGWYLRQYIALAKEKGVKTIVCSPIAQNDWKDGKLVRSHLDYTEWAKQTAINEKVGFIDLNTLIADSFEKLGEEKVKATFFNQKDHVHTLPTGAEHNASIVAAEVKKLKRIGLRKYLK